MKPRKASSITKEEIQNVYFENNEATMESAAKELNCSRNTLTKALRRYDLVSKSRTRNFHKQSAIPKLADKEWLKNQIQTKSLSKIADELGTTVGNVSDRVGRYGFRQKDRSAATKDGIRKSLLTGRVETNIHYVHLHLPNHPFATKNGSILEHRIMIENKIGRYLTKDEVVHHINGIKNDNRIENLLLCNVHAHKKIHGAEIEQARLKKILDEHNITY